MSSAPMKADWRMQKILNNRILKVMVRIGAD